MMKTERSWSLHLPMDWLTYTTNESKSLADTFIRLLPDEVQSQTALVERLRNFVISDEQTRCVVCATSIR